MPDLAHLLHTTFGHPAFRANQEAVCVAATAGQDVLLVMPTGAGKSLCYQLPAIARGGTALVISPLIALMDDQAGKLSAAGLKVARIHSGLSRDDARQACRDYLDGTLNFLFIAPERMRVPGFPEMLARRKPSLVAIDEAHCISAWGHDFRPDYRTLGEHLPALRPAPIIALTATATPTVQRDIVTQLSLATPALFIHGFRRSNLAIEVVEMSKPRRGEFTANLLKDSAARPAIVYAPSRKACEELAGDLTRALGRNKAAAYHAGLEASTRERVQTAFQAGTLEVVVATIAFGMGIDKADVRTVVHTALPASVEAYYQEIGRAGRDGLPSRTVLLHSYQDRKMHEFFLERDYPPATDLARVAQVLTKDYLMPEPLARSLKMDLGTLSKAIEKLVAQGVASTDLGGNVRLAAAALKTPDSWRAGYDAQIAFRRGQIDRMAAFAETAQCRMAALIHHFGDTADGLRPCGCCDVCSPASATAQTFAAPGAEDLRQLSAILRVLDSASAGQSRSTGKLHSELAAGALRNSPAGRDRKEFDALLDSLTRGALITLTSEIFTNPEGNVITYRKAALTHEGREAATSGDLAAYGLMLKSSGSSLDDAGSGAPRKSRPSKASVKAARDQTSAAYTPAQRELEDRLRAWRKAEAAKTGKPAFMVFGDTPLKALVYANPQSIPELLTVVGIGPDKADRYGADIVALCGSQVPQTTSAPLPIQVEINDLQPPDKSAQVGKLGSRSTGANPRALGINPRATRDHRTSSPLSAPHSHLSNARPKRSAKPFDPKRAHAKTRAWAEKAASLNRRIDLEADLRTFAQTQAEKYNQPASSLVSEGLIEEILESLPTTINGLQGLKNLRGDLPPAFAYALLSTCVDRYQPEPAPVKERTSPIQKFGERTPTFTRPPTLPELAADLTPEQEALDVRLRAWRKSESERLGLPQFFVLGASTLRSIVLMRPSSVDQLQSIAGIGAEKAAKFGSAICEVCNA